MRNRCNWEHSSRINDEYHFFVKSYRTRSITGQRGHKGPSIKYVTLFLANFDPPPPVTHPGTPQSASHISDPPRFSVGLVQKPGEKPLYKFSLNCSRGLLSGGAFVKGSFVWHVLSGVGFFHYPFCQNT